MAEPEVIVWHDESDRLVVWGTLDPPDACMCRDCVLGPRYPPEPSPAAVTEDGAR